MKKYALILVIFVLAVFSLRFMFGGSQDTWLCDQKMGVWVKHGNPSSSKPETPCGESQLSKEKKLEENFVCDNGFGDSMEYSQAKEIAVRDCKDGRLKDFYYCNNVTGTWWIDFSPNEVKDGCNPACVVNVKTGDAEINWRCTGLAPNQ